MRLRLTLPHACPPLAAARPLRNNSPRAALAEDRYVAWRPFMFGLGWLGFAALFAAQSISSYSGPPPTPVTRTLAFHVLEAAFWALASLGLHQAAWRMRRAGRVAAGCILFGAVASATLGASLWNVLESWIVAPRRGPFPGWDDFMLSAHATFAYGVLMAVLLVAASTAVHLADEARARAVAQARAEAALVRERLEMLTLHLQPHFLFNTLNTIVGLVPAQPQQAVDIVHRLSALLRAALQHAGSVLVPLQQELDLVHQYLGIARVRHGARLRLEIDIGPGLQAARVPLMLLQPLLENALQHSVEARSGPGLVRLQARTVAHDIELCVEDDGVGLASELAPGAGQGIGLSTTRQRLAVLYGDRATLTLVPREGGGARACMRLPLHASALEERAG